MQVTEENKEDLVQSFIALRKAIGYLGAFLPLSLIAIGATTGRGIEPSISQFYYTHGRDLFFGTLFAIGGFLLAYTGYRRRAGERLSDRWLARVAGAGALGVAFVPTRGAEGDALPLAHAFLGATAGSALHYACAALFFVCLALFCFVQFPKGNDRARNRIYRACGVVIVASLALMGATGIAAALDADWGAVADRVDAIFWLETAGVLAFAFSWLTKGQTLPAQPVVRMVEGLSSA